MGINGLGYAPALHGKEYSVCNCVWDLHVTPARMTCVICLHEAKCRGTCDIVGATRSVELFGVANHPIEGRLDPSRKGIEAKVVRHAAVARRGEGGKRKLLRPAVNSFAGALPPNSLLFGGAFQIPRLLSGK